MICIPGCGRHKAIRRTMQSRSISKVHCSIKHLCGKCQAHVCCLDRITCGYSPFSPFLPFLTRVRVSFLISYTCVHSWREKIDSRTGRRKTRGAHYWLRENDGARIIMIRHETPGVTWVIVNYLFPILSLGVNNLFHAEATCRKSNNAFHTQQVKERERDIKICSFYGDLYNSLYYCNIQIYKYSKHESMNISR